MLDMEWQVGKCHHKLASKTCNANPFLPWYFMNIHGFKHSSKLKIEDVITLATFNTQQLHGRREIGILAATLLRP